MSAIERLRTLLAEATPGPWERVTEGSFDQRHAAAKAFLGVMATKAEDNPDIQFSDLTYIRAGFPNVAMVGNGPKQTENGDLIAEAVNALPALLGVAEAAQGIKTWAADEEGYRQHRTEWEDALRAALAALEATS